MRSNNLWSPGNTDPVQIRLNYCNYLLFLNCISHNPTALQYMLMIPLVVCILYREEQLHFLEQNGIYLEAKFQDDPPVGYY